MYEEINTKRVLLAADLDGTFLGGTDTARHTLYSFIEANRDWLGLVFVTGRDLAFINDITSNGVPRPDAVIGDVGTTVVSGKDFKPITEVEDWIDAQWPGAASAEALLENAAHLKKQSGYGGRRVSYFYDDLAAAHTSAENLQAAGYDVLMSDGVYFDVLPRGVQKGPTLNKLVSAFDLSHARILVAGDTLNDRSLFETGMDGVAVANSEPLLVEAIKHLPNVHFSIHEGAAGVFDGLKRKIRSVTEQDHTNA